MSKFQHTRDNILTPEERAVSARKCVQILKGTEDRMDSCDYIFFLKHRTLVKNIRYAPSEPELQWLRDLVERYGL